MQFFRITVAVFMMAFFGLASVHADEARPDVRIVIDISGSMKETDPENLRRPALNLLTELLPDDARAGVWTFGRYVNMLVPLDEVDQAWRSKARGASAEITSVGLNTNLVGALEKALYETSPDSGYEQTVILLTDGRIDMDKTQGDPASVINAAERQRLINSVLPKYMENRVRIHTLALSDAADTAMLQQIAMETDGLALKAHTADDLMPAFLKAFDRAVPAEQVPLKGNTFQIDGSVREFTALIFRAPTSTPTVLISPSGKRYGQASLGEDTRWHHDLNFDLITIDQPEAGEWNVEADLAPDSRVQVLSDLKLNVTGLPGSLFSGVPVQLEMALENEGELVTEPTLLQLTDVTLQVTAPDGRTGSKLLSDPENLPPDGIFRETLSRLTQPGEYRLEINAEGRTFQRRQVLTATLAEPLRVEVNKDVEQQVVNIRVYSESDMVDTALSRVISRIASPDGSSVIYSMEFSEESSAWQIALRPDKGPGQYDVMLNIRGVSSSGMTFKSKPENILVSFPLVADASVDEPPVSAPLTEQVQVEVPAESAPEELAEPEADQSEAPAATGAEVPVEDPPALPAADESPVPDLASKYAEQEQEEESDSGVAWWVYVLLAVANLGLLGGLAWWWFARRGRAKKNAVDETDEDIGVGPLDDADLDGGDFDSFDDDTEEEINAAPEPKIPTSMGGDADMGSPPEAPSAADDIAPDLDDGGDDWGEFDLPDDDKKD